MNKQTLAQYKKALKHLQEAQALLEQIGNNGKENWGERGTANHFRHEISELISCDHGEAGLEPYILNTEKKLNR